MSIKLNNVISGYQNFELETLDLEIEKGSFTILIGPNGCGKSTLLKTIAQQLNAKSGSIFLENSDYDEIRKKEFAQNLAFLPQHPEIVANLRIEQLVAYGRSPYQSFLGLKSEQDKIAIENALKLVDLTEIKEKELSELSGGQRQRAFFAMILAQATDYILLDEPTSFLDIKHQYALLQLMQQQVKNGKTCVMVLHDIAQAARFADDLIVMKDGKIINRGNPNEVVTAELIKQVYDIECEIGEDPIAQSPIIFPT